MSKSMPQGGMQINFGPAQLTLLADRSVYWAKQRTLFIADTHFGKDATFRKLSIPVPAMMQSDLRRIDRLIELTDCETVVCLGDLIHSRRGRSAELDQMGRTWRAQHPDITFLLIRGNHDKASGDPCESWEFECHDAPYSFAELTLTHYPQFESDQWSLSGHLHPKYHLVSQADEVKLPCFLARNRTLVLPAFAEFVDHGIFRMAEGDTAYTIADDEIIAFEQSQPPLVRRRGRVG